MACNCGGVPPTRSSLISRMGVDKAKTYTRLCTKCGGKLIPLLTKWKCVRCGLDVVGK